VSGPLSGLRIVELAGLGPAPYCGMLLADLGADVVRVDRAPRRDEGPIPGGRVLGRGKRSIALDLKRPEGVKTLLDLVARADALVEPFRPGVAERLGFGPEKCLARNPRLVYGRLTGWGQVGPYAPNAGHDVNFIALAGVLGHIGPAGQRPAIPLNLVGDMGGGGLFMAFGLLSGLIEASRSGRGQVVDVAMIDGAASLMAVAYEFLAAGEFSGGRGTHLMDGGAPYYGVYECADGEYVSIGSVEPPFYDELLGELGFAADELPPREQPENWPTIRARFEQRFRSRTRGEWMARLERNPGLCFAPVLTMPEAADHPHHRERGSFVSAGGIVQPAPAPRFSRTGAAPPSAAPRIGENSAEILADWLDLGGQQTAAVGRLDQRDC
jgi:alpha-methylacyl-CoA racemase